LLLGEQNITKQKGNDNNPQVQGGHRRVKQPPGWRVRQGETDKFCLQPRRRNSNFKVTMAKRRLSTSKPSFTGSSHLPMEIPKNAEQHPCTPLAQTLLVVSTGSQAANHVSCSVSLSKWHCEVQRYALDPTLGSKSVNFWQSYQISLINIKISQPPFALPFNKPLLHRKEKIPKRPWPTGGSNLKTLKSQKISGLEEKRIFFNNFVFFIKIKFFTKFSKKI